jgi:capsular polysaccharide biosynthesis protein
MHEVARFSRLLRPSRILFERKLQMSFTKARYITAIKRQEKTIHGCAYNEEFHICPDSQRFSKIAEIKHYDPPTIPREATLPGAIEEIHGPTLYLGHAFATYGHFLLETLPMMSYIIHPRFQGYNFIFHPFNPLITGKKFIAATLEILGMPLSSARVFIHDKPHTLAGDFTIAPRPIEINHRVLDKNPYKSIIYHLKETKTIKSLTDNPGNHPRKLFLPTHTKRTSQAYKEYVEKKFSEQGFCIIRPEKFTFAEQIAMIHNANIIAAFSGSALHNAIYAKPGTIMIEIGDNRSPSFPLINQKIVAEISGAELHFIPYLTEDIERIVAPLCRVYGS